MEIGGDSSFSFSTFFTMTRGEKSEMVKNEKEEEEKKKTSIWLPDSWRIHDISYTMHENDLFVNEMIGVSPGHISWNIWVQAWSAFYRKVPRAAERERERGVEGMLFAISTNVLFELFHTWRSIDKRCIAIGRPTCLLVPHSDHTFRIVYTPMSVMYM